MSPTMTLKMTWIKALWISTNRDEDDDTSPIETVRSMKRPLDKVSKPAALGRSKKERMTVEMKVLHSLVDTVKQPQKVVENVQNNEDAIFGQFIVSEMRKITDANCKLLLKQTITNALFQARIPLNRVIPHCEVQPVSVDQNFQQYPVPQYFPQQHADTGLTWHHMQKEKAQYQSMWAPAPATRNTEQQSEAQVQTT
jgi:hypothetical protein